MDPSSAIAAAALARLDDLRHRLASRRGPEAPPAEREFLTEACLQRYLVARNADVDAAERALLATLAWREDNVPRVLRCAPCEADATTHCIVPLGWDAAQRPVVWGCPARGRSLDGPTTVAHVTYALEHVFAHERSAEQWVWCVDFNGFGLRDVLNVQIGLGFASVLPTHYPERLGKIIMINRPFIFDMLLGVLRPILDARTLSKLCSVKGTHAEVAPQLREHGFDEDTVTFIVEAMARKAEPTLGSTPALPAGAAELQLPRGGSGVTFTADEGREGCGVEAGPGTAF